MKAVHVVPGCPQIVFWAPVTSDQVVSCVAIRLRRQSPGRLSADAAVRVINAYIVPSLPALCANVDETPDLG
jgi:hypothetical protein